MIKHSHGQCSCCGSAKNIHEPGEPLNPRIPSDGNKNVYIIYALERLEQETIDYELYDRKSLRESMRDVLFNKERITCNIEPKLKWQQYFPKHQERFKSKDSEF